MGAGAGAILGAWAAGRADPAAAVIIALAGLAIILVNRTFWLRQVGLGFIALGLVWVRLALGPAPDPGWPATVPDRTRAVFEGTVLQEPAARGRDQELWVDLESRRSDLGTELASGRVVVRTAYAGPVLPGDRVVISGTLRVPGRTPDFDYRAWLAARGVSRIVYDGTVLAVEPGDSPAALAGRVRRWLGANLRSRLPADEAALAEGLVLGLRSGLSAAAQEAFNRTGTTHILVVSGYNVGLVGTVCLWVGRLLFGARWGWASGLLGIGLYIGLVGLSPPTIRAGIMGVLGLVAVALGRPGWPANGLGLAVAAMLLADPGFISDLSFQLSVLATAGIIFLAPAMQAWYAPRLGGQGRPGLVRRVMLGAADVAAVTAAAWAATTPVILAGFRMLSAVAIPANVVIAPAVPAAVFGSAVLALAGPLGPVADILALVVRLPLGYILGAVRVLSDLPGAAFGVGPWGGVETAVWLGVVGALAFGPARALVVRTWPLAPVGLAGGALLAATLLPHPARVDVYDLGGRRLVLVEAHGLRVLVGSTGAASSLVRTLSGRLPAWDRNLDLVVWTDPGRQESAALSALGREFTVGRVVTAGDLAGQPEFRVGDGLQVRVYPGPGGEGGWVVLTVGQADVAVATGESAGEPPGEALGAEVVVLAGPVPDGLEAVGYVVGSGDDAAGAGLTLPVGGRLTFWSDGRAVWPAGE